MRSRDMWGNYLVGTCSRISSRVQNTIKQQSKIACKGSVVCFRVIREGNQQEKTIPREVSRRRKSKVDIHNYIVVNKELSVEIRSFLCLIVKY